MIQISDLANLCFANTALADASRDNWRFLIAPYGWLASLGGDITAKGRTSHVRIPFNGSLLKMYKPFIGKHNDQKRALRFLARPKFVPRELVQILLAFLGPLGINHKNINYMNVFLS